MAYDLPMKLKALANIIPDGRFVLELLRGTRVRVSIKGLLRDSIELMGTQVPASRDGISANFVYQY